MEGQFGDATPHARHHQNCQHSAPEPLTHPKLLAYPHVVQARVATSQPSRLVWWIRCSMKRSPLWTLTPQVSISLLFSVKEEGYQYSGVSSVPRRNGVLSTRFASVWLPKYFCRACQLVSGSPIHHGNRGAISIQLVGLGLETLLAVDSLGRNDAAVACGA
jgi:hypothetical protein